MDFTRLCANLTRLGYSVSCFDDAEHAAEYIERAVSGKTVGIGGSMTVREMGLYERLTRCGRVYWHWVPEEGLSQEEMLMRARRAEIYISSVNAIAETGEIINIDGNCNRVSEIMYGHEKVYLIAGENKIAPDYGAAMHRARNIAAPLNAGRLNRKTPCAIKGDKCYDCNSPERICRGVSVLMRSPSRDKYEVILVHERLGF